MSRDVILWERKFPFTESETPARKHNVGMPLCLGNEAYMENGESTSVEANNELREQPCDGQLRHKQCSSQREDTRR